MYGTLRGALAGRKIEYDGETFKATVEGRISGIGKTIRIKSIHVHYDLAVPAEARESTERALQLHPQGCPAHQSVKDAISITWDAAVRIGERTRPHLADEAAELLRRKGEEHERAHLERLRAEGRAIVEIALGEPWNFE